jgi:RimJ/RimL family protein N-acetyltransferase
MTISITLREVLDSNLPIFFEQQLDPDANYMAAFTSKDPTDREAFDKHWARIRANKTVAIQTILYRGQVAGSVLKYEDEGHPEVSYWLGKEFWGKGIATAALRAFLEIVQERPMYARSASDNAASIRVLEKCGFAISGKGKGFANARGQEIEEYVLILK